MSTDIRPVIIIGAGLGGLTLAQCLHNKGIPFRVFERDPSTKEAGQRSQGWCISLHSWIMDELRTSVRDDEAGLRSMSPSTPLGLGSEGVIYVLPEDGMPATELFRFGQDESQPFVRVERAKLRQWLLKDIEQYIEWGKYFTSYEESADGITAHFEDGSSVSGVLLVGADGVNSRVRTQVLGTTNSTGATSPTYLPMGIIIGEVVASREQYLRWLQLANSFSAAFATNGRRLFIGLKAVSEDLQHAEFYWMFGWPDENASLRQYWTTAATKAELHAFVMKSLSEQPIDSSYADVFLATPIEGIVHPPLRMRDMVPIEIPSDKATLLGDAIHCMVPFRGEGGNMAMKDAIVLGSILPNAIWTKALGDALKTYEREMIKRATSSVLKSRESTFLHPGIFDK